MGLRRIFLAVLLLTAGCSSSPVADESNSAVRNIPLPPNHTVPELAQQKAKLESDLILNLLVFLHTQKRWLLDECDKADNLPRKAACEQLIREVDQQLSETWTVFLSQESNQVEKVE